MSGRFFAALARQAAQRYPARDRFARGFARGKLTRDPVFRHLLEHGLIPRESRLLDLGCGQAVLFSLLLAARAAHSRGDWPEAWAAPPNPLSMRGIELVPREVARAHAALGHAAEVEAGDIRSAAFGSADAVVILDVLHYVDFEAQADVLQRVRDALGEGGVLLLRVADAGRSWRFRYTELVDRLVMRLRGHRLTRLWNRPVDEWTAQLRGLGFEVEARPMSQGTAFANTLLVARYHRA